MVENSSEPGTQAAVGVWPAFAASIASLRETGQCPCIALLVGRFSEEEVEGGIFGACTMETSAVSTEFRVISESRMRAGSEVFTVVVVLDSSDGNEASEDDDCGRVADLFASVFGIDCGFVTGFVLDVEDSREFFSATFATIFS